MNKGELLISIENFLKSSGTSSVGDAERGKVTTEIFNFLAEVKLRKDGENNTSWSNERYLAYQVSETGFFKKYQSHSGSLDQDFLLQNRDDVLELYRKLIVPETSLGKQTFLGFLGL